MGNERSAVLERICTYVARVVVMERGFPWREKETDRERKRERERERKEEREREKERVHEAEEKR